MSSSEEENTNSGQALGSATTMSRRLKTFGSPDLAVTVGEEEHLYNYHSLILASQSLYVDTILSSPAARTEQEKGRISFPDITRETWEKMMKFLLPATNGPSTGDLVEIVPFYDKYQFLDGLAYCDKMLVEHFGPDGFGYNRDEKNLAWLTAYIYDLPPEFFPKSRPLAIKWGKQLLSFLCYDDEETIKTLLPILENDNETTRAMVSTLLGRECVGMTMNEMRDLVKQTDFPEQCIFRSKQIEMLDAQRRQLKTKNFNISGAGELVSGYYDEIRSDRFRERHFAGSHNSGAMGYIWKKKDRHRFTDTDDDSSFTFVIAAVNCYGSAWEIYSCAETDDAEEAELSKRVLYKWDNGIFTSLVPPQFGWEKVEDDETCVKSEMYIDYSFDRNPHSY
jgi:hypothetical protein